MSKANLPWIEKYRPQNLDDIMSQNNIVGALNKYIDKKLFPHLLFFGPSGCGKTSTIMCCAKKLYGEYIEYMILRLNSSYDRGIDIIRTKVKNFVSKRTSIFLPPEQQKIFKIVIMDEIDSMTDEAQGMLRQIIEKNSLSTRFCLICNDINKINPALQSRCAHFRFSPLKLDQIIERLNFISQQEKINIYKSAINIIAKISMGDMRIALNNLQHIALTYKDTKITKNHIYDIMCYTIPDVIDNIYNLLIKLSKGKILLENCINDITNIVDDNNITINSLLDGIKNKILESNMKLDKKLYLINNLALIEIYNFSNIEYYTNIQIMVAIFV